MKDFKQYLESIKYDTTNGPSITTWSGDNRPLGTVSSVAGGNGGNIAGGEFDNNQGTPTSSGERPIRVNDIKILNKRRVNRERQRKIKKFNDLYKQL
jgi:hypothetical protein